MSGLVIGYELVGPVHTSGLLGNILCEAVDLVLKIINFSFVITNVRFIGGHSILGCLKVR